MSRKVIAVDGLAGSGKSTIARLLAEKLGFSHLNTGLLYRAVGLLSLRLGLDVRDERSLESVLPKHKILLDAAADGHAVVRLDGSDVTGIVQTPEVSEATSYIAQYPVVRQALLQLQRQAFPGRSMVAEGRDMGTVVFPDATAKFFIVADEKIRVERRLKQLFEKSSDKSVHARQLLERQIGIEIAERDRRDSQRALSPALAAADAIQIDNSSDSLAKVLEEMAKIARTRGC